MGYTEYHSFSIQVFDRKQRVWRVTWDHEYGMKITKGEGMEPYMSGTTKVSSSQTISRSNGNRIRTLFRL